MGLPFSRNSPSEAWFTLQDEPVHDAIGESSPSGSRPPRGRGLVRLVEPAAQPLESQLSTTRVEVPGTTGARFTRRRLLERWNAHAARLLSRIGSSRFGALALGAVIVVLALAVVGLLVSRGSSSHTVMQPYGTQIARLKTERGQAIAAAAQAGRANADAQRQLARWRSRALSEQRTRAAGGRGAGHNNGRGGGR
jgi:hypothetical protein